MGRERSVGLCVGLMALTAACGAQTKRVSPQVAVPSAAIAAAEPAIEPAPTPAVSVPTPKLEVVFVLDTTGSMASLIDGAKQKIWSIADELASAKPAPELRIGLIAYRDRGDDYVTKRFALTDDIDAVYQNLYSLHADGGGDTPESVNQALHEAVHETPWSQDTQVYRAVFLVGDAPPHMDYRDDVPYRHTVREASERGIVINTVQCGDLEATKPVWLAIADRAHGTYAAIAQDGGMDHIAAPMDEEIGRLNAKIAETAVPYGSQALQEKTKRKVRMARSAPAAASASRHAYLRKKGRAVVTGKGDLVDDVANGHTDIAAVEASQLPSELRDLSHEERRERLQAKKRERRRLQQRLDTLVRQRAEYVRAKKKAGKRDGFDEEVMKAVKTQAESATGITY